MDSEGARGNSDENQLVSENEFSFLIFHCQVSDEAVQGRGGAGDEGTAGKDIINHYSMLFLTLGRNFRQFTF